MNSAYVGAILTVLLGIFAAIIDISNKVAIADWKFFVIFVPTLILYCIGTWKEKSHD